ncbi:MAG: nicotinate (nicotinamide) nucleotide adenylyltransferase [Bacteroidales bacterium]
MQVGLFFGSFNPVHIGHMVIAQYMLEFTDIDELWFVITPHNPLKKKVSLLNDYDRHEMILRAIEKYDTMHVSSVEFSLPKPSYTVVTLAHLREVFPNYNFTLIMGGDNLCGLQKWRNYTYILDNFSIYVYSRPDYDVPQELQKHASISYFEAPLLDISSSFIRQSIQEHKNMRAFMPCQAWEYLDKMNFYKV